MSAPPTATTAPITDVHAIASTNACRAVVSRNVPASPPICAATADAPASESRTAFAAASGSPATGPAIAAPYEPANRLPSTAMPSAPPTSRVVSLTADPTPNWSGGSEPMIASVAGVMARPMPAAEMNRMPAIIRSLLFSFTRAIEARPPAMIRRPRVVVILAPKRLVMAALMPAAMATPSAIGMNRNPVWSALRPSTCWR